MAVFATVDIKTLDEGAASLGASPWRRFRDVIVPNALPGILAGSLMVVTLSLGEFNLTWMLHTPLTKTLPIGLADSYASMRLEVASAYTLIFFVMIIPLLVAMQLFAEKEQKTMSASVGHGASVRIEACGKTFADGTRALEPATLDIARGETLVLLGPSGCGKTTMLRIIAGLELPDAGGKVLFDGKDMTSVPIERRNVGMVFQSYALFPNMSVADNIGYGLKIRGVPDKERAARVAELVALTNISGLENRRIDQLSGGQRQRVALARAVAIRPGILLLDEPLTALDAALRDRLRGELNRLLRALGITTIYVTHDQAEAMELGDRVVVMQKGAIAQIGTPREIYFTPKNRFVAEFIGAANIIEAAVENGHLVLPGGRQPIGGNARHAGRGRHDPPRNDPRGGGRRARRFRASSTASVLSVTGSAWSSAAHPSKPLTVDAPNTVTSQGGRAGRTVDFAGRRPSVAV